MVFTFDAALAWQFLRALQSGEPIRPPASGWTQAAALTLAGVTRAHFESFGPHPYTPETWNALDESDRLAIFKEFSDDANGAVMEISLLVALLMADKYHELYEPRVTIEVSLGDEPRLEVLAGRRDL